MVPVVLLALLSVGTPAPVRSAGAPGDSICVVAHVPGDTAGVDLDLIRRIFLERQRFWPDGTPAHPVNLPATSPVRERFSRTVLGASVRELTPYWDERYFHGTRPPLSVGSEEAALLFVARTRGAVGYVDGTRAATLPDGVRALLCFASSATPSPAPNELLGAPVAQIQAGQQLWSGAMVGRLLVGEGDTQQGRLAPGPPEEGDTDG